MSITVNGQSCVPPGFRFHPTEEELLGYYLRKKVASEKIDLDVIRDVDLNKLEPWEIQEECRIGSTQQSDWYFFSHKDKKYPTGTRTNRATAAGFWKATGRDKAIFSGAGRIGMRKTLVFYKGRAPRGQKSDWIMHEYRLDEHSDSANSCALMGEATSQEEGWVVCRVFKKKSHHHHKAAGPGGDSPKNSSSVTSDAKTQLYGGSGDGALDQILHYMGRSYCRQAEFSGGDLQEMFMKLPAIEIPAAASLPTRSCEATAGAGNWAAIDRLLASRLNGTSEDDVGGGTCFEFSSSSAEAAAAAAAAGGDYEHDHGDLWSLTKTSSSTVSSEHVVVSHASGL